MLLFYNYSFKIACILSPCAVKKEVKRSSFVKGAKKKGRGVLFLRRVSIKRYNIFNFGGIKFNFLLYLKAHNDIIIFDPRKPKEGFYMLNELACCFTGHRSLGRDFDKQRLRSEIEALICKGVKIFIAGGALGFDTEAATEVILQKMKGKDVKLYIYAPCTDQDKYWAPYQKTLYRKILEKADLVSMPSTPYTSQCMRERNYKMVDDSDYVIAYYNGEYRSGTGQTVRYAYKRSKQVINLCKDNN